MALPVTLKKKFPTDYAPDAVKVLEAMSFGKDLQIFGTGAIRSQLYSGDYDGFEETTFKSVLDIVKRFKNVVYNILSIANTYIGDIKCGTVEEFKVVPDDLSVTTYSRYKLLILQKLHGLYKKQVITKKELVDSIKYLKPKVSIYDIETIKYKLRFNIVRWTPKEINAGFKYYRNKLITLAEALQTPTITKIDVISWMSGNRYCDFSIIYVFKIKGKVVGADIDPDLETSIKKNMIELEHDGKYFKLAKRMFALTRFTEPKNEKLLTIFSNLFNSDLGNIYQITGDLAAMKSIIDNTRDFKPVENFKFELGEMIKRMSSIVIPKFLQEEPSILHDIHKLIENPITNKQLYEKIENDLNVILNDMAKRYLKHHQLLPLPKKFSL